MYVSGWLLVGEVEELLLTFGKGRGKGIGFLAHGLELEVVFVVILFPGVQIAGFEAEGLGTFFAGADVLLNFALEAVDPLLELLVRVVGEVDPAWGDAVHILVALPHAVLELGALELSGSENPLGVPEGNVVDDTRVKARRVLLTPGLGLSVEDCDMGCERSVVLDHNLWGFLTLLNIF